MHKKGVCIASWLVSLCTMSAAGITHAQVDTGSAPPAPPSARAAANSLALYPLPPSANDAVKHGRYLAMAGDCAGCHTVKRSHPFAGGLPINTPFGVIYTTNISSDATHGIGSWTFDQFYTAMHDGIAPGHRYLYPAFPYPSFSKMSKQDVQDLWNYIRTLPSVSQANRPDSLMFPLSWRPTMFFWRTLFFSPKTFKADAGHNAEWNRGAYLTGALGHCGACHSPRGRLGEVLKGKQLSGGIVDGWWAPNITGHKKDGLGEWSVDDIVQYLRTGSSPQTSTFGPMGIVVEDSLQYLTSEDLRAVAVYLQSESRPANPLPLSGGGQPVSAASGKAIYEQHCESCHEWNGTGYPYAPGVPGVSPPLANNPAVMNADARNVVMVVLNGNTETNTVNRPLPYSMPGYAQHLTDKQIAAVVNYIRNAWGHHAPGISAEQVQALRSHSKH